jgi:hypothetical protein
VDVIQVGNSVDAFYLKLRTRHPASARIVAFLQQLRMDILRYYAGTYTPPVSCTYSTGVASAEESELEEEKEQQAMKERLKRVSIT